MLKKFTTNCHCQITKSHNTGNFFLNALNPVPPHKHWETCKDNPILKQNAINLHACDTVQISGRVAVTLHTFLTCEWIKEGKIVSVLHYAPRHEFVQGSEWGTAPRTWQNWVAASCDGHIIPRGKGPDTHWIQGSVGPRAGLHIWVGNYCTCRESNPETSAVPKSCLVATPNCLSRVSTSTYGLLPPSVVPLRMANQNPNIGN